MKPKQRFERDALSSLGREFSENHYDEQGFYRKKNDGRRQRKPRQLDKNGLTISSCPSGYDADLWYLADGFFRGAQYWGHTPDKGRPIIYLELESRVRGDNEIMQFPNWKDLVRRMIMDYWNKYSLPDNYSQCLNDFICSPNWENNRDTVIRRARDKKFAELDKAGKISWKEPVRAGRRVGLGEHREATGNESS